MSVAPSVVTLPVATCEASLLPAVVVVPAAVAVHLHAALLRHLAGVKGRVGLTGSPVEESQGGPVCPAPADCNSTTSSRAGETPRAQLMKSHPLLRSFHRDVFYSGSSSALFPHSQLLSLVRPIQMLW